MPTSKARWWFVEEAMVIGEGSSLFPSIVGPSIEPPTAKPDHVAELLQFPRKKVTRPSFRTEVSLHIVSVRLF